MALSKPSFLAHLRTLAQFHGHRRTHLFPSFITLRHLSFDTPEEAAAERRRRKRRLRIEPPLSSLNRSQQTPQPTQSKPIQNPNAPKIPEPVSALSGNRLKLHNKILTLIRENDLEEAALFTRHSIYSNCRPTIYTVNAVLNAQLRQSKYSDLLSLHRFITQAGVAPNVITYNLIFQTYLDCRKPDTATEHYKQFINDSPVNPSPTTYRILVKGLVENGKLERAVELLQDMSERKMDADPFVYSYLMLGSARKGDADEIFRLYEELKEKRGGMLDDGVIYGNLMKGYFIKGMEKEAMECYEDTCGENSKVKMSAIAYNFVLDALSKYGKFDEALKLFDRMRNEHNPPRRLSVNLGSFNVIVDGYCAEGRFKDAIEVFRKMGDYRCSPDTLSFNNLIDQLCKNEMLAEAEEIYGEMGDKGVNPDEYTYGLLMDTCFRVKRIDDGAAYFKKMVESRLRPNLAAYKRLIDELVKEGKIDEAKSFYDTMVKKLKMDDGSYKFMMKVMSDVGRLDDVLKMVDGILEEGAEFSEELQEFVKEELAKEGRAEDLTKLMEEKERLKAEAKAKEIEAAEAAKRSARAAVSSLLPSKLFGNKEADPESTLASGDATDSASATTKEESVEEATIVESSSSSSSSSDESEPENDDKVTS